MSNPKSQRPLPPAGLHGSARSYGWKPESRWATPWGFTKSPPPSNCPPSPPSGRLRTSRVFPQLCSGNRVRGASPQRRHKRHCSGGPRTHTCTTKLPPHILLNLKSKLFFASEPFPPPPFPPPLQLEKLVPALLTRLRLPHGVISVSGTPRRLAVVVADLALTQPDSSVEVRGPPRAKAFDAKGQPSGALQGFCRKNGVDVGAVSWRGDERGVEYAFAVKEERGRATEAVLGGELAGLVGEITFPKTMRWSTQVRSSVCRPLM